jgi:hypothetical protein
MTICIYSYLTHCNTLKRTVNFLHKNNEINNKVRILTGEGFSYFENIYVCDQMASFPSAMR